MPATCTLPMGKIPLTSTPVIKSNGNTTPVRAAPVNPRKLKPRWLGVTKMSPTTDRLLKPVAAAA